MALPLRNQKTNSNCVPVYRRHSNDAQTPESPSRQQVQNSSSPNDLNVGLTAQHQDGPITDRSAKKRTATEAELVLYRELLKD